MAATGRPPGTGRRSCCSSSARSFSRLAVTFGSVGSRRSCRWRCSGSRSGGSLRRPGALRPPSRCSRASRRSSTRRRRSPRYCSFAPGPTGRCSAGCWAAITLVCAYGLATRLFPERLGYTDSIAGYRLEAPLGYWNALAIFAAIGTLLAAGFVARGRRLAVRMLAAASTVVLVPTLYFTFSRGGWIALAAGLVTIVLLDTRRLQFLASLTVVAPWPAIAVWHASRSQPLTHVGGGLAAAEHAGHRYVIFVAVLLLVAAAVMFAFDWLEAHARVPDAVRIGYAIALVLVVVAGFAAVTVRYGSPVTIARKGYDNFVGVSGAVKNGDLNTRLFSLGLGQRVPQWKVAWHDYTGHPVLGSGLGSYERYWNQDRTENFQVRERPQPLPRDPRRARDRSACCCSSSRSACRSSPP